MSAPRFSAAARSAVALGVALVLEGPAPWAASPSGSRGSAGTAGAGIEARVEAVLEATPLIDGHNDVPWQIRRRAHGDLEGVDFDGDTRKLDPPMHTDLARLERGMVGGQFWSVYVPASLGPDEAVRVTLEQIDVVHRMVARWPERMEMASTAADVERIHASGKLASLIGMEGGHSIGNSMGALRMMYEAGARYMTITHWKNNDWADAATDDPKHDGLSEFGEEVIREMNRLGMLVDLSHVSAETMRDAIRVSEAPVIFSHSGAAALNPHPRNVPDDVLKLTKKNRGVVMVDFLPTYVSEEIWHHGAERHAEQARLESLHLGDPEGRKEGIELWDEQHPKPRSTLADVCDHIDHIKKVIGSDSIGIGSDFDGMGDQPDGLDDVSAYPALLAELARRGYSDGELAAIAGGNALRVIKEAEAVAARLQAKRPPSTLVFER